MLGIGGPRRLGPDVSASSAALRLGAALSVYAPCGVPAPLVVDRPAARSVRRSGAGCMPASSRLGGELVASKARAWRSLVGREATMADADRATVDRAGLKPPISIRVLGSRDAPFVDSCGTPISSLRRAGGPRGHARQDYAEGHDGREHVHQYDLTSTIRLRRTSMSERTGEIVNRNFADIFSGDMRYVIPFFQRGYVWGSRNWESTQAGHRRTDS